MGSVHHQWILATGQASIDVESRRADSALALTQQESRRDGARHSSGWCSGELDGELSCEIGAGFLGVDAKQAVVAGQREEEVEGAILVRT